MNASRSAYAYLAGAIYALRCLAYVIVQSFRTPPRSTP